MLTFIRLSRTPSVTGSRKTVMEVVSLLEVLVSDSKHRYLDSLPAPCSERKLLSRVLGHRQVTDAYLLSVAEHHSARLLTFDSRLVAMGSDDVVELIAS